MFVKRLLLIMTLLLVSVPASAQDADTTRDPWSLAQRLLDYNDEFAIPPLTDADHGNAHGRFA
jgi:hypothetical protein